MKINTLKVRASIAFLVFVSLLALPAGSLSLAYAQQGVVVQNSHTTLYFDSFTGAISSWEVSGSALAEKQNLVTEGELQLRLVGDIAGKGLEQWIEIAGGWKVKSLADDRVSLLLEHPMLPFLMEQVWEIQDSLWAARLQLRIEALQHIGSTELSIVIGPGIGDEPVFGLGVADGLYSFTEVIFEESGEVERVRLLEAGESRRLEGSYNWIGLHSRYFALALTPGAGSGFTAATAQIPGDLHHFPAAPGFETMLVLGLPVKDLGEAGEVWEGSWQVFGGGKSYDALVQSNLQSMLFSDLWQWMRWLTLGIMHVLYAVQSMVVNWGIAIICLAILVRLAIHPIAKKAMASQRRFAALQDIIQPEIREIKRQYKGGEQSERILHVYERNNISPLAGLKPLLIVAIQIPIFIALFHLLGQAFELRETSFLWMASLAEPDKLFAFGVDIPFFGSYFNLLPLLMSVTNILSIILSPTPADEGSGNVKKNLTLFFFALMFFLLFYSFPSGMVLYWTMANVLHLAHSVWSARRAV